MAVTHRPMAMPALRDALTGGLRSSFAELSRTQGAPPGAELELERFVTALTGGSEGVVTCCMGQPGVPATQWSAQACLQGLEAAQQLPHPLPPLIRLPHPGP